MDLPPYLHPQEGGWRLEDAVSIWLLVHYDIAPTTAETPAVQRLRARAQQEVSPLLTLAPGEPVQRPATRIVTRYLGGGEESRWPQLYLVDNPKTWVPADALAGLCRQHGHTPPWEPAPAAEEPCAPLTPGGPASPTAEPATGGQQDFPPSTATPTGSAGRMRLYDDLVREVEQEHRERTLAANGIRVTKAECIRAVVNRHLPTPDPTDYQAREKVKAKRDNLIEALTHRMKPSRAP